MQMRHYLHNGKGYRALPYTKLKLMLCAFQPYIKLNFRFLSHMIYHLFSERVTYLVDRALGDLQWVCCIIEFSITQSTVYSVNNNAVPYILFPAVPYM